ncbi:hypothetical protein MMPV_005583 [Pyropia vietnamensis]
MAGDAAASAKPVAGTSTGSPPPAEIPKETPDHLSFPGTEEAILSYWDSISAFDTANTLSAGRPVYSFYDGPPFASGLPHYGHILAGHIKDVVTRYAYQTGHHVPRAFGWDCHGLPIEYEIDQRLGITSAEDVERMGVAAYNAECRAIVMRYSGEWEAVVRRIGRWIDFKGGYKTLDPAYMESVWWVFSELHKKGLVYRGFRVMPYSTGCTTPLSNFEANQNYKDVDDPAVTVCFPVTGGSAASGTGNGGADGDAASTTDAAVAARLGAFIAWTTTPWTLPSNLALCVHPDLTYVTVDVAATGARYTLARARLDALFPRPKKVKKGAPSPSAAVTVVATHTGAELVGVRYAPPFDYYVEEYKDRAFRVLSDTYVTDSDGTGVVHQAPAFGEDDYRVCAAAGVIDKGSSDLPCPVDASGRFTEPVSDWVGVGVKVADKGIVAALKASGRLVRSETLRHSYPFCWRSETPLIYRAVPAWFIAVEELKARLLANNTLSHWVPTFVQTARFGNWLEAARDWNVSRNRYWGTPLPIWRDEATGETLVVGSVAELETLSGRPAGSFPDLHRESVDDVTIVSPTTGCTLRRVPEVFDCWFESGSMPYAAIHYPFAAGSAERLADVFPADFVAEGLDQTRGWFYTLLVLATALFDKTPFKNCVVNGLVLAEDGKKMSKRLRNYPDPMGVVNAHGADALRLYLINSPVVRAEPLRFREAGVKDVVRDVLLPWYNAFRFFVQNTRQLAATTGTPLERLTYSFGGDDGGVTDTAAPAANADGSANPMDAWISSTVSSLITHVRTEMAAYRLYTVIPALLSLIDALTNWYVRLNRPRLKGLAGPDQMRLALATLGEVLLTLSILMAPFAPFFADHVFQALRCVAPPALAASDSVHFVQMPVARASAIDPVVEASVGRLQEAITLGRLARERRTLALKQPLARLIIVHRDAAVLDAIRGLESYVTAELNVRVIEYSTDEARYLQLTADADGRALGRKLGKRFAALHKAVRGLDHEQVAKLEVDGRLDALDEIAGAPLGREDFKIVRQMKAEYSNSGGEWEAAASGGTGGLLVLLDTVVRADLAAAGLARELVNRIQKLRKRCGLEPEDRVEVFLGVVAAPANATAPAGTNAAAAANGRTDDGSPTAVLDLPALLADQAAAMGVTLRTPPPLEVAALSDAQVVIADEVVEPVGGVSVRVVLARGGGVVPSVGAIAMAAKAAEPAAAASTGIAAEATTAALFAQLLAVRSVGVGGVAEADGRVSLAVGEVTLELRRGVHYFGSVAERVAAGAPP